MTRYLAVLSALLLITACADQRAGVARLLAPAPPSSVDTAYATVQADLAQVNTDMGSLKTAIDATPPVPPQPPVVKESPDGATIVPGVGTLVDDGGNTFNISAANVTTYNGNALAGSFATLGLYFGKSFYHQGTGGSWWVWKNNGWQSFGSTDPRPAKASFFVAPGGSDVASGTQAAPFESLGRCQAAMANSPAIKNCNVSATGVGYYDFSACSIELTTDDDGETWAGDPNAVLDGGGKTPAPFIMGPATNITLTGFTLRNFTGQ
jgi:hypothetical protein